MCCGSKWLNQKPSNVEMNHLTVVTEDALASLLELAANNDVEGFKRSIEHHRSDVDEVGLWYGRQKGSKQIVNEERTPLMVASIYGSIDVIKLILSCSDADVNRVCGLDKSTALHCAASGGAINVIDVVKLLLAAGADVNVVDANGRFPVDVIVAPPKLGAVKSSLEELLATENSCFGLDSPMTSRPSDAHFSSVLERKEYTFDPSIPGIKNSIYSTDEFRMYSFKVRHCSRAYSHDWAYCPYVHPGENARRRDPRKFNYSYVPCSEFRKGRCRRGVMCEYAHGVFECWLHPAHYRTRLCKDGTSCARRVCFFAHTPEEVRPTYASTGSAVHSPRSNASAATAMDFAAAMSLLPGSPSSVSVMSPSPFTPPMSHSNGGWPQPNVPALHLPGSNLQSSRLRSSHYSRDIQAKDFNSMHDFDLQQHHSQPSMSSSPFNRSGRMKTLTPSNLDDLFPAENSSTRYSDQSLAAAVFSPTHKSTVLNSFQQQQNMLSPMLQAPLSGRMSTRNIDPISPMSSRVSMLAQRENQQRFRSLSSRQLGSSSDWGSSNGKPDWAVNDDGLGIHRRSSSFELGNGDEPDLSWIQSLVKESPTEIKEKITARVSGEGSSMNSDPVDDSTLGASFEQMQLDQLVAHQNRNRFQ